VASPTQGEPQTQRWACTNINCHSTNSSGLDAQEVARTAEAREFARTAKVGAAWFSGGGGTVRVTLAGSTITSDYIEGFALIRLKGNVEIATRTFVLRADEAQYNWRNGEVEAQGRVRVTPAPQ
jgi:lipopolysaccharide assembly outer membrane protein LptD (OstA)